MKRYVPFVVVLVLAVAACSGKEVAPPSLFGAGEETESIVLEEQSAEAAAPMEEPQAMEVAEVRKSTVTELDSTSTDASVATAAWDRKIIKNATIRLETEDVFSALNQVTIISSQYGGYVVSSRTWYEDDRPHALYSFAVPVETFEEALGQVRRQGTVLDESTTGQDVTDQYVDLEARIRNLEATATRVRSFLDDARTVEEALAVNRQLSQIEEQLERLKGQRNALEQRAAFSTITVEIRPLIPEGTPVEQTAWSPAKTLADATAVLMVLVRRVVDAGIWVAVVGLPIVLVFGLIAEVGRRLLRMRGAQI